MRFLAMVALALLWSAACATDLWLAPGKSVTIFDAADPSVRLVLTAPADAPLELGSLLELKPGDSVHSIATRVQLRGASAISRGADGALVLNAATVPPAGATIDGGVLVRDGDKWLLHREETVAAPQPAPAAPAAGQKALISKAGATKEQAERDIQECRGYAERAASQILRPQDKAATYNGAMQSCLRGFGYTIQMPPA
jgi:hypothetical protein